MNSQKKGGHAEVLWYRTIKVVHMMETPGGRARVCGLK